MRSRIGLSSGAIVALVASLLLTGPAGAQAPTEPSTSQTTLTTPEPGATRFGEAFDIEGDRAVVYGFANNRPRVYVFDHVGGTWTHTATIKRSPGGTSAWARSIAVNGDTVAIADPSYAPPNTNNFGRVHVFDLTANGWTETQTLADTGNFNAFVQSVGLTDTGLIVAGSRFCDGSCGFWPWRLYQRSGSGPYVATAVPTSPPARPGIDASIGIDENRFAVGAPAVIDPFDGCFISDSTLVVGDTSTNPPAVLVDELVPRPDCEFVQTSDDFRHVDLSGDVLAIANCCSQAQELEIRRDGGNGVFGLDDQVPLTASIRAVGVVPGVIVHLDDGAAALSTLLDTPSGWVAGADIVLPGAVPDVRRPLVADADRVMVAGDEAVHIVTITPPPSGPLCMGLVPTVDLASGDEPTPGDDIILGTTGDDIISAGAGDDIVCARGGDDVVVGGFGNDDIRGGTGADVIFGGSGDDELRGRADGDLLIGGPGRDVLRGERGPDILIGGLSFDECFGGPGFDGALTCESTTAVP
ncbi:MAG: calcium-binding protein [Acidimicrobiales bacterium]